MLHINPENNLIVGNGGWSYTLNRDPNTMLPTTYVLKRTNNRSNDIVGNWRILKNSEINPDIIIYQLDPDEPENSIS